MSRLKNWVRMWLAEDEAPTEREYASAVPRVRGSQRTVMFEMYHVEGGRLIVYATREGAAATVRILRDDETLDDVITSILVANRIK